MINLIAMRIVRKLSRKKFFSKVMYEYERFLVPVPSKFRDVVRPWHGLDMRVFVEPCDEGFAMLICREDKWHRGRHLSECFRRQIRQLSDDSGPRTEPRGNYSGDRIHTLRSSAVRA